MKEIIFSREDARNAKIFPGEPGVLAGVISEICPICKDVDHSRIIMKHFQVSGNTPICVTSTKTSQYRLFRRKDIAKRIVLGHFTPFGGFGNGLAAITADLAARVKSACPLFTLRFEIVPLQAMVKETPILPCTLPLRAAAG